MVLACIKIFVSRIIDVSLGTLRTMFVVKGNKIVSSLIAFVEVFVWFYAARVALVSYDNSIMIAIFYSLGYATGTYLGTLLNEMLVDGIYNIEVISSKIKVSDILKIKKANYGLSVVKTIDNKLIIYLSISKKRYKDCIKLIKSIDKDSFIVVNDAKVAFNGYFRKRT
ncbi:MAG: DUF2179 domain-containing protein [Erysipelotrichales bacterium]|nr:DUF2179 domain-containing protein [Erysipelotrichales bacterium]